MAERLNIYLPRSPRYVLVANENRVLRFMSAKSKPISLGTQIVNVSKSGLAFTFTDDSKPIIGELITIQFQVPNRNQMACYAEVVRIENDICAVRFINLSPVQRLNILWGLKKSFDLLDEYNRWHSWKRAAVVVYNYSDTIAKVTLVAALYFFAIWSWMAPEFLL